MRKNLAKALRAEGRLLPGVLELMTGEVDESGLLRAATGETGKRIGIDSGLSDPLGPIYEDATICGAATQVGGWEQGAEACLEAGQCEAAALCGGFSSRAFRGKGSSSVPSRPNFLLASGPTWQPLSTGQDSRPAISQQPTAQATAGVPAGIRTL